jgi:hypothetical protein
VQGILRTLDPDLRGGAKVVLLSPGELFQEGAMHAIDKKSRASGVHAVIVFTGKCDWGFKLWHRSCTSHVTKLCRTIFAGVHGMDERFVNSGKMYAYMQSIGIHQVTEITDLRTLCQRVRCSTLSTTDRDLHIDRDTKDILFGEKMEPEAC